MEIKNLEKIIGVVMQQTEVGRPSARDVSFPFLCVKGPCFEARCYWSPERGLLGNQPAEGYFKGTSHIF